MYKDENHIVGKQKTNAEQQLKSRYDYGMVDRKSNITTDGAEARKIESYCFHKSG
jgi:hypothetical protein